MEPDFPSETTTLFVSTQLACLHKVTIGLLTCCHFCIAILLESIPFYLFLTHRLPAVFVLVTSTCIQPQEQDVIYSPQQFAVSNSPNRRSIRQEPAIPHQSWLHRRFDQLPRSRPRSRAPLVRYPSRTPTTHFHKFPTTPASCLPQSSSSVPFPTTRGRILRVEEVCTKWRNNRTRLVGGGPVPSSKFTTNPPSQSSS